MQLVRSAIVYFFRFYVLPHPRSKLSFDNNRCRPRSRCASQQETCPFVQMFRNISNVRPQVGNDAMMELFAHGPCKSLHWGAACCIQVCHHFRRDQLKRKKCFPSYEMCFPSYEMWFPSYEMCFFLKIATNLVAEARQK